ncbi:hypothetical protein O2K51_01280 [Apibacter raozihei]|uniref:hypothetical protein n=1 Tax=Apibacter raozihei TaxID=2500547 RepID=UPI000FE2A1FA|nr:hypothetical protein [Apibacter raozihei]
MKALYVCLFVIIVLGCREHRVSVFNNNKKKEKENKIRGKNKLQHKYINVEEVKDWSLEQIKHKYKPIEEEDFLLNDIVLINEFRIGLYNIFKGKDREKPVPIKEVTWEKDEENNYTIWYRGDSGQWVAIDWYVWAKSLAF